MVFGPQPADFSIGHVPDGTGGWKLTLPTVGSANIAAATGDANNIRINEWAASVANGPDWFELYNPNPQPVALGGLYLTDKLSNRTKHLIAPLTFIGVSTNACLKFVADSDTAQGPNHVNFSLDLLGEAIGLFPPAPRPPLTASLLARKASIFPKDVCPTARPLVCSSRYLLRVNPIGCRSPTSSSTSC